MIKLLHGKRYYIEMTRSLELVQDVLSFLKEQDELKDEDFFYSKHPNGNYVIISESDVEAFRGKKYSAWERVKRYAYKIKKEAR